MFITWVGITEKSFQGQRSKVKVKCVNALMAEALYFRRRDILLHMARNKFYLSYNNNQSMEMLALPSTACPEKNTTMFFVICPS